MANQQKAGTAPPTAVPVIAPPAGWTAYLPVELRRRVKDFFIYSAEFLPLAAGATASQNTAIQADADFLICALVGVVTDTANTTFVANVPQLATIVDAGSGRQIVDRAVHFNNLYGTAQLPFLLPYPKLMRASGTLTTTLQNLDGANARNVRCSYIGFKIFGEQEQIYTY